MKAGIMIAGLLALVLTGCQKEQQEAVPVKAEAAGESTYIMQIGHAQPISHPRHQSLLYFKYLLEECTDGDIQVELFPAAQLGSEASMLDEVCQGSLQGFRGGQLEIVPQLMIFSLPFLFSDREEAQRVMNSDFAMEIANQSLASGATVLGISDAGGFRQLSCNQKIITKPADLEGLKMRSNGMDTMNRTLEALGAEVQVIPYNDLYLSAKAGIIDGQENSWANVFSMRFYEVQKYFTQIDYQFHPEPFYVNTAWFEQLPLAYQQQMRECAAEMNKKNIQLIGAGEKEYLEEIMKNAEVYFLTKDERQAFVEATRVVYDQYIAEGLVTEAELAAIREIIHKENPLSLSN